MIEFEPESHIYRVDGAVVPSVTQILDPYTGLEFVDRETLQRAAEFGSHVHEACHLFNMDELDRDALDADLAPYVDAWERFLDESGAVVLLSEHRVASRKYGYAGTLDSVVHWGKTKRLVDIKTGAAVPRTVGPQTFAYTQALSEEGESVSQRHCIHLKGDGTYSNHKLNDPRDWSIFQSALNLHNWYHKRKAA